MPSFSHGFVFEAFTFAGRRGKRSIAFDFLRAADTGFLRAFQKIAPEWWAAA